jgi:hypothetical protein
MGQEHNVGPALTPELTEVTSGSFCLINGASKNCPFRSPERWECQLPQRFPGTVSIDLGIFRGALN